MYLKNKSKGNGKFFCYFLYYYCYFLNLINLQIKYFLYIIFKFAEGQKISTACTVWPAGGGQGSRVVWAALSRGQIQVAHLCWSRRGPRGETVRGRNHVWLLALSIVQQALNFRRPGHHHTRDAIKVQTFNGVLFSKQTSFAEVLNQDQTYLEVCTGGDVKTCVGLHIFFSS